MHLPESTPGPLSPRTAEALPPSTGRRSAWRALAHRNYALFFAGHGMSLCGTWMQSMAMAWLVYRLSGSPFLLGLVEFIARGPILLFSVFGGLLADRWPRNRLMMIAQSAMLLQATALAVLTFTGMVTVGWILVLALALGLISALEIPVRQSFVADLVPRADIPSAIGLNSSLFNAARVVGPSAAGLIVAGVGEAMCFLINALSFVLILGCLLAMRLPPKVYHEARRPMQLLAEGFTYAWRTPHVRAVLAVAGLLSVFAMPYSTLLPVFARDVLHQGPEGLGLLMAASGIGALMAAIRHAGRAGIRGLGASIARSAALFGVGLLGFAGSEVFWMSAMAMVAIGFGMVSAFAGINILLQSLVPDALRGRVLSLFTTLSLGVTVFGSLLAGTGASYVPAPVIVMSGGVITLATAAWFWRALPVIRRHVKEHPLAPEEAVSSS